MKYPFNKSHKKQIVAGLLFFTLGAGFSAFVFLISSNKISLAYNDGYQPDQPLPFSHALHVGEYRMDCRYCHTAVEESRHATVPSLDICMNCHLTVKPDSPYIQQLTKAYTENQPVVWEKVHLLPDFVKFNHSLHVKALAGEGKGGAHLPPSSDRVQRACATCHGKVESMDIIYQKESLSMGWCVNCHRKEEHKAPLNCTTCHY